MKTRVQLYQAQDPNKQPPLPVEFFNAKGFVLQYVLGFMRLFGIARITARPKSVGIKSMVDVSFRPLPGNPPEPFEKAKGFALRNVAEMMHLFGVLDIEMLPDESEMDTIRKGWETLSQPATAEQQREEIQLNIENDPTGKSVLEETPDEQPGSDTKPETGPEAKQKASAPDGQAAPAAATETEPPAASAGCEAEQSPAL